MSRGIVRYGEEMPVQLDCGGKLTAFQEGLGNGGSGRFVHGEHATSDMLLQNY